MKLTSREMGPKFYTALALIEAMEPNPRHEPVPVAAIREACKRRGISAKTAGNATGYFRKRHGLVQSRNGVGWLIGPRPRPKRPTLDAKRFICTCDRRALYRRPLVDHGPPEPICLACGKLPYGWARAKGLVP
jgi:hypothetical protein